LIPDELFLLQPARLPSKPLNNMNGDDEIMIVEEGDDVEKEVYFLTKSIYCHVLAFTSATRTAKTKHAHAASVHVGQVAFQGEHGTAHRTSAAQSASSA
jgi:hypothetical protein